MRPGAAKAATYLHQGDLLARLDKLAISSSLELQTKAA
jgi:hypothetical protein